MEIAWAYIKKGADGNPEVVRSSHPSIAAVKTGGGSLIVTFPGISPIFTCMATPGKIVPVRLDGPVQAELPANYPRSIAAAPGDQSHLASNQVRVQLDYGESASPRTYEFNLMVWGEHPVRDTFYVQGRHLYDPLGEQVVLRGVNEMKVYENDPAIHLAVFPEIRRTGANAVRIVWGTEALRDGAGNLVHAAAVNNAANLDAVIQNCRDNHMIPLVDLHDTTGNWAGLDAMVDYWVRPDIVQIVQKHRNYFLLNIANEAGNENVSIQDFKAGYTQAITRIRNAGIRVPLIIDAANWGKEMRYFFNDDPAAPNTNALDLMEVDAILLGGEPNLIFSLHAYWSGFDPNGISAKELLEMRLDDVAAKGIPFIAGEFSVRVAAPNSQPCVEVAPWQVVLEKGHEHALGWFAWEWGPGNGFGGCPQMDMTLDGKYDTITAGWAREVALDHPYSIRNTAVTPASLQ